MFRAALIASCTALASCAAMVSSAPAVGSNYRFFMGFRDSESQADCLSVVVSVSIKSATTGLFSLFISKDTLEGIDIEVEEDLKAESLPFTYTLKDGTLTIPLSTADASADALAADVAALSVDGEKAGNVKSLSQLHSKLSTLLGDSIDMVYRAEDNTLIANIVIPAELVEFVPGTPLPLEEY